MFHTDAVGHGQDGFILMTVSLFLLMIGAMVFTLLRTTHLGLRMSQNYSMASQQFQAAEAGLSRAEGQLERLAGEEAFHAQFTYAGYPVSYEIDRLSSAFCMDGQIAYYYRITAQAGQAQGRPVVLQTTYARRTSEVCTGKEASLARGGRSSWRELD